MGRHDAEPVGNSATARGVRGRFAVGVIVERRAAKSPWLDHHWRPVEALAGVPAAAPWTPIGRDGEAVRFYVGAAVVELHRTETTCYRDNLASGAPALWVALRPSGGEPPFALRAVTADPSEGEAFTEAGNDLVETVPMPDLVARVVAAFVAAHHVERPFVRRRREPAVQHPAPHGEGRR